MSKYVFRVEDEQHGGPYRGDKNRLVDGSDNPENSGEFGGMKWRKIMDGVYEGESFQPIKIESDWQVNQQIASQLEGVLAQLPATIIHRFHFTHRDGSADHWHVDGQTHPLHDHMLVLMACADGRAGTEIKDERGHRIRKCKPWTPYVIRSDVKHRAPRHQTAKPRHFFRFYLQMPVVAA